MEITSNKVIGYNSLNAPRHNADFDGDNMAVMGLHSNEARDHFKYMYARNIQRFEFNGGLIDQPEHESIFASYMLSYMGINGSTNDIHLTDILNFDEFNIDFDILSKNPSTKINICGVELSYAAACINKMIGILHKDGSLFYINELLDKKGLNALCSRILDEYGNEDYSLILHHFNKSLLTASTIIDYAGPTFKLGDFAISSPDIDIAKGKLINEPYIAFHQNHLLFTEQVYPQISGDNENILKLVVDSGARIKTVQLLKAASNNGIPTDINGRAFIYNIKDSLLDGLSEKDFYMSGDSARLALAQRQESIPKGGELQRKFFFTLGFIKMSTDTIDCCTSNAIEVHIIDKQHLEVLVGKYYSESDNPITKSDTHLIGETINMRSPIFCECLDFKICKKCFGDMLPESENLGALVGSYIAEAIIQSVLRTHHFGGAFITPISTELMDIIKKLSFSDNNMITFEDESHLMDLKDYMYDNHYGAEDIEFEEVSANKVRLNVINPPFNDDAVKQLNNIITLINKQRLVDDGDYISPVEMYKSLYKEIVEPNGIFSVYIELIISVLYYDVDGISMRYSNKIPHKITPLSSVITNIDPRLNIFHILSQSVLTKIYQTGDEVDTKIDHMLSDLIDIWE